MTDLSGGSPDEGQHYKLPEEVKRAIDEINGLDRATLLRRAAIQVQDDPEYLRSEAIVYRLRRAHVQKDRGMFNGLWERFEWRCQRMHRAKLLGLADTSFDDVHAEAMDLLFAALDRNSKRGQFLQVKFNKTFEQLCVDAQRKFFRRLQREVPWDEHAESNSTTEAHVGIEKIVDKSVVDSVLTPEEILQFVEDDEKKKEKIKAMRIKMREVLTPREHDALILTVGFGYKQKAVSKQLNVNDRTIRSDVKSAIAKLRGQE